MPALEAVLFAWLMLGEGKERRSEMSRNSTSSANAPFFFPDHVLHGDVQGLQSSAFERVQGRRRGSSN